MAETVVADYNFKPLEDTREVDIDLLGCNDPNLFMQGVVSFLSESNIIKQDDFTDLFRPRSVDVGDDNFSERLLSIACGCLLNYRETLTEVHESGQILTVFEPDLLSLQLSRISKKAVYFFFEVNGGVNYTNVIRVSNYFDQFMRHEQTKQQQSQHTLVADSSQFFTESNAEIIEESKLRAKNLQKFVIYDLPKIFSAIKSGSGLVSSLY